MTHHIPREPHTWTPPTVRYTQPAEHCAWCLSLAPRHTLRGDSGYLVCQDRSACHRRELANPTDLDALTDPVDFPVDFPFD